MDSHEHVKGKEVIGSNLEIMKGDTQKKKEFVIKYSRNNHFFDYLEKLTDYLQLLLTIHIMHFQCVAGF